MKVLYCQSPGHFEYRSVEQPKSKPGWSIVKIKRIGVCGTDLHAFEGTQPYFNYPRVLGHELAAEIVETNASGFQNGELVTILPYFHCGSCIACINGKPNCCVNLQVCGVHIDGGMSEYLAVPDHSLIKNPGLTLDELALAEPFAIGTHGVRRASIREDEWVLVIGAGPIGLATMEMAKIAGGRIIAMDINKQRLEVCSGLINPSAIINSAIEDPLESLSNITNSDMPTVVIDATGNLNAINGAFRLVAHGGRYVLIGLQKGEIVFSHPEFHKRELTLMSSRNATREDFEFVMKTFSEKRIDPTRYITHRAGFHEIANEFAGWLDPSKGVIKVMIEME